jgi:ribose 5-phosphate isomerase
MLSTLVKTINIKSAEGILSEEIIVMIPADSHIVIASTNKAAKKIGGLKLRPFIDG